MDSAAALKCSGYGFKLSLAEYLDKGSVHWRGGQSVNVWGSAHWEGVYSVAECRLGV